MRNRMVLTIVFVLIKVAESSRHYGTSGNATLNRFRRQTNSCKGDPTRFQCETNPDCIENDQECDGKDDCPDGSDEKESLCSDIICPGHLFRCDYGACISGHYRCNGKRECKDNSDEANCPPPADKVNTNCRSDQYECNNGQCIEIDSMCNGVKECRDGSDETEQLCLNTECPGYTYKCKYGACVNGNAECNQIQECADNSDEEQCGGGTSPVTSPSRPTPPPPPIGTSKTCVTPAQPLNGKWRYFQDEARAALPNEKVPAKTSIVFECDDTYRLSSTYEKNEELIYCRVDGQWSFTIFPQCEKLCPKQYNKNHAIIECKLDGSIIPCHKAITGTVLKFTCDNYYEPASSEINTCSDGTWHQPDPRCKPVCGEKRVSAEPLVVGGRYVIRGDYPWIVAIFSDRESSPDYDNICGGTLLSVSVVVTAAHCVTSQSNGRVFDPSYFQVAAGKYYREFEDPRDLNTTQYSKVKRIFTRGGYRGEVQNFAEDIALLELQKPFALSKVVQPVCFERSSVLGVSRNVTVAGWGFTTNTGNVSDILKEIDLEFVDNEQCRSELDPEFELRYLIPDKLCAGYVDKGVGVCKGDSGGGLVVRGWNGRYFLEGIVSLAHSIINDSQETCNTQRRALFTRVHVYREWVEEKVQMLTRFNTL